ncbi:MAG: ribokinase [Rhodobacteraceae bacterium]|nr:ribokinase [Paracoccaceae bacterium]
MPKIWSFGSINADHAYLVPHIPAPGETIAAREYSLGLGGKGANQSAAAAKAGATVAHIGLIGPEGLWAKQRLAALGVDTQHINQSESPTGHAIITVDETGENAITIFPGANRAFTDAQLEVLTSVTAPGDLLILQNETNLQAEAARIAVKQGLIVFYSAAPFSAEATRDVLPHISILLLNEIEAAQLKAAVGALPSGITVVVTKGSEGADWITPDQTLHCPAFPVKPVDTTGAGDTFAGYLAAAIAEGQAPEAAMRLASAAAALKVTRKGTADAIPSRAEVEAFLARV